MEQHHPIMDKLGDLGDRTYRQTYLKYRNCNYTYHVYAFLERITVVTYVNKPLGIVQNTKMSCAIDLVIKVQFL